MLLRQMLNSEACKGAALSRSDSLSNPGLRQKQLRQTTNIETCKAEMTHLRSDEAREDGLHRHGKSSVRFFVYSELFLLNSRVYDTIPAEYRAAENA